MRRAISHLTDTVTLHAGDQHLAIAPMQEVDLDRAFGRGTIATALGALTAKFAPVAGPVDPTRPRGRRMPPAVSPVSSVPSIDPESKE